MRFFLPQVYINCLACPKGVKYKQVSNKQTVGFLFFKIFVMANWAMYYRQLELYRELLLNFVFPIFQLYSLRVCNICENCFYFEISKLNSKAQKCCLTNTKFWLDFGKLEKHFFFFLVFSTILWNFTNLFSKYLRAIKFIAIRQKMEEANKFEMLKIKCKGKSKKS